MVGILDTGICDFLFLQLLRLGGRKRMFLPDLKLREWRRVRDLEQPLSNVS